MSKKERKTRKLTCIVTGRALLATRDYYERKIKKAGSEEKLHRSYVCKEAKDLLIKGYTVDKIRDVLNVNTDNVSSVPEDIVKEVISQSNKSPFRRINNSIPITNNIMNPKTDPDVKEFIQNILKQ
mgnify:CR=1 FL=1